MECYSEAVNEGNHYSDIIMSAVASQTAGVSTVCSSVCSGTDKKKTSKLRVTGFCEENSPVTGELPWQKVSNAENASIWWRHHAYSTFLSSVLKQRTSTSSFSCPQTVHLYDWTSNNWTLLWFVDAAIDNDDDNYQSGRSPKEVALFSATNLSSYIIELLQLHDIIQIKWNYT